MHTRHWEDYLRVLIPCRAAAAAVGYPFSGTSTETDPKIDARCDGRRWTVSSRIPAGENVTGHAAAAMALSLRDLETPALRLIEALFPRLPAGLTVSLALDVRTTGVFFGFEDGPGWLPEMFATYVPERRNGPHPALRCLSDLFRNVHVPADAPFWATEPTAVVVRAATRDDAVRIAAVFTVLDRKNPPAYDGRPISEIIERNAQEIDICSATRRAG